MRTYKHLYYENYPVVIPPDPRQKEGGQKWEGGWGKERGEFRRGCREDGRP